MCSNPYSEGLGSTIQPEAETLNDEIAELMLVDREAPDWEEDSGSNSEEIKRNDGDCDSEDEGNLMDTYDGLGSDPEWIDTDD